MMQNISALNQGILVNHSVASGIVLAGLTTTRPFSTTVQFLDLIFSGLIAHSSKHWSWYSVLCCCCWLRTIQQVAEEIGTLDTSSSTFTIISPIQLK